MQTAFTIEAWIYLDNGATSSTIIDRNNYNFTFQANANGTSKLGFYNANGGWRNGATDLPFQTWIHVAVTWDDATDQLKLYVNGNLDGTHTIGGGLSWPATGTNELSIGRQDPNFCQCNTFQGDMDELRLSNIARTPGEISNNADQTAPVITLTGNNPQIIEIGGTYTELGATASDNIDGDISANITVDASAVNVNTAGSYSVTYNVSDAAGNAATEVTRTVNVLDVALSGVATNASCANGTDGSVALTPSGGTAPYTYGQTLFDDIFYGETINLANYTATNMNSSATASNELQLTAQNGSWLSSFLSNQTFTREDGLTFEGSVFIPYDGYKAVMIGFNDGANSGTSSVSHGIYLFDNGTGSDVAITARSAISATNFSPSAVSYSNTSSPGIWVDLKIVLDGTDGATYYVKQSTDANFTSSATLSGVNVNTFKIGVQANTGTSTNYTLHKNWRVYKSPTPTSNLAPGNYTYYVRDANGFEEQTTVTVGNDDTTDPTITITGGDTIDHEVNTTYIDAGATANDNCSATITNTVNNVNANAIGQYTVVYTATDSAGRTVNKTRTVNVVDTTAPTVVTQNITVALDATGNATITPAQINNGSSDSYSATANLTLALDKTTFDCSDVGQDCGAVSLNFSNGTYAGNANGAAITDISDAGFTLEAWIKPSSVSGINSIIRKDGDYNIYLVNGTISADVWDDSDNLYSFTSVGVNTNVWTHIAMVWNGASGQFYVNGSAASTSGLNNRGLSQETSPFDLGRSINHGQPFYGNIDDVRLWSDERTSSEISNNFTECLAGNEPNLEIYYKTLAGSGTTLEDFSPNGFDATIVGGIWSNDAPPLASTAKEVILTVTDEANNSDTASAFVTVEDNINPTITITGNTTVTHEAFTTYTDGGASANDNCSASITSTVNNVPANPSPGNYTVVYTATDSSGNTGTATRTVQVTDTIDPEISSVTITSDNSDTEVAIPGDVITLSFTSSEDVNTPTVTIAGESAIVSGGPTNWTASITVDQNTTEGATAFVISAIEDLAGNTNSNVTTLSSGNAVTVDVSAPVISNVKITSDNANTAYAKLGDKITLTFSSNETINTPSVTIAGRTAAVTNPSGNTWSAEITTNGTESEVLAAFVISSISDVPGNTASDVSTLSSGNGVTIDFTPPSGYSLTNITNPVNIASIGTFSFEVLGLEANSTYNFTIEDVDGNTSDVTGNGSYGGSGQAIASPNIANLTDGVNAITLTLYSTDAAGNQGADVNGTTSKDTERAVITLLGDNPQIIDRGTPYVELGATGTDNLDGIITNSIVIDASAVNINVVDCYPVYYSYTDAHGNAKTVTRTVWILEHAEPYAKDDTVSVTKNSVDNDIVILSNDTYGLDGPNADHPISLSGTYTGIGGKLDLVGNIVKYTPPTGYVGVDDFSYTITDASGDGVTADVTINVTELSVPVANDDTVDVTQGGMTTIDVLDNDMYGTDGAANSNALTVAGNTAQGGTVVVNNAKVDYTPANGFTGTDSFTYTITDGNGDSDSATVTVNVTPLDPTDKPTAVADAATVTQNDSGTAIDVLANDSFGLDGALDGGLTLPNGLIVGNSDKGGTLSIRQKGTLSPSDDDIVYTPATNFVGTDYFKYMITDANGDTSIAEVTITVTQANTPTAIDDAFTVTQDSSNNDLAILDNDSFGADPHHPTLPIIAANPSAQGGSVIVVENGTIGDATDNTVIYTPPAGFTGIDTFVYTLTDIDGDSDNATVTITVVATTTGDTPTAQDDAVTVSQNSVDNVINILDDNGNGADSYGTDGANATHPISLTAYYTSNGGKLVLNGNTVEYTPKTDFYGTDSFDYLITDASGDSDRATVTVTVSAPTTITVVDDTFTVDQDSSNTTLDITANDIGVRDTNGAPLVTVTQIRINGVASTALGQVIALPNGNGTVVHTNGANGGYLGVNDDTFSFTPTLGFSGQIVVPYELDYVGGTSSGTFTINVTPLTSTARLSAKPDTFTVTQNSTNNILNVLADNGNGADDFGADGALDNGLTLPNGTLSGNTDHGGTVTIDQNGTLDPSDDTILYTPQSNFYGADEFKYMITDADGDTSITIVDITITEAGTPTAVDDSVSVAQDSGATAIDVLANDTYGSDGASTTVAALSVPVGTTGQGATVVVNAGKIDYTPAAGYTGADGFTYTITDDSGDTATAFVSVTVNSAITGDTPTAQDDAVTVNQDSVDNIINILDDNGNGADSYGSDGANATHPISLTAFYTRNGGALELVGNIVKYTPSSGFSGTDTFNYIITDASGDADTATVTITVNAGAAANNTPTAQDDSVNVNPNSVDNVINILDDNGNGADTYGADGPNAGHPISLSGDYTGIGGKLELDGNTVKYTPPTGFTGVDSFSYTLTDANGDADTATVTINVNTIAPKGSSSILTNEFSAYPNPSKGYVKTEILSTSDDNVNIYLMDTSGKIIYKIKKNITKGKNIMEFNFDVSPGVMFIKIIGSNNFGTNKIVFE